MAMEERHTQIREGAGLEESRLNVEFIDWLRKWSTPILVVLAAASLGYAGWHHLKKREVAEVNRAFRELEAAGAVQNPSPESLKRVAEEFEGVRGVAELARLRAADAYLAAVRRGLKPGAQTAPDGTVSNADDLLTPEDRERYLSEAAALYERVANASAGDPARLLYELEALYGLAAVAESRGDLDGAKGFYERVIGVAERSDYPAHVQIARARIEGLDDLRNLPRLYARAELPARPAPAPPAGDAGADAQAPAGEAPAAGEGGGAEPSPEGDAGAPAEPSDAESPAAPGGGDEPPAGGEEQGEPGDAGGSPPEAK